jgi:hypothetical protein
MKSTPGLRQHGGLRRGPHRDRRNVEADGRLEVLARRHRQTGVRSSSRISPNFGQILIEKLKRNIEPNIIDKILAFCIMAIRKL